MADGGGEPQLLNEGERTPEFASNDSPLFVATWYTIATAIVTAIGAAVGSRVLRY